MITSEYILELSNVFHSGQVEAGTCIQKMIGTVRTGVILKDVSLEVHGGELSAVLGSKGTYMRSNNNNVALQKNVSYPKYDRWLKFPTCGVQIFYYQ